MKPLSAVVMLQWNDYRNGSFQGVLMSAEFDDALTLESPYWNCGIKARLEGSCIVLGGKKAERFTYYRHKEWVGNWCWDAVSMPMVGAVRLANWLVGKGFRPDYGVEPLFEAAAEKRALTVEDFLAARIG